MYTEDGNTESTINRSRTEPTDDSEFEAWLDKVTNRTPAEKERGPKGSRSSLFFSTPAGKRAWKAEQPPEPSQFTKQLSHTYRAIRDFGFDHEHPGKYIYPLLKSVHIRISDKTALKLILLLLAATLSFAAPAEKRPSACGNLGGKKICDHSDNWYADQQKKKEPKHTKKVTKPQLPVCLYDKQFNLVYGTPNYYCPDPQP